MSSSSPSFTARERRELADLLDRLGPGGPAPCEGGDTAPLAAHLVVRERRPDALVGLGAEQVRPDSRLASWTHRLEDELRASTPYPDVGARLRAGPPAWSRMGWPGLGDALNTTEFAIHHEDVRRAQPDWSPRTLPRADQDALWGATGLFARRVGAAWRGGLVLRRSDVDGAERRFGDAGTT